jgi:hypothetical protein
MSVLQPEQINLVGELQVTWEHNSENGCWDALYDTTQWELPVTSKLLRNVDECLLHYTAQHPMRQSAPYSFQPEPQTSPVCRLCNNFIAIDLAKNSLVSSVAELMSPQ